MYLTEIFIELIKVYAPVVVAYCFTLILFNLVSKAFRGM